MNNYRLLPLTLIAAAVLASCSSMPDNNSQLDQARSDYNTAQSNPQVAALAPSELKQAGDSLDRANTAWTNREKPAKVDHLAYIATRQVAVAQATASQKSAELAVANSGVERERVRLAARTNEANAAQLSAENAKRDAEASQRQTAIERQSANDANRTAAVATQQASDAESRARQLEAQLKDMEAKKTDRGMVITLGDVLFDTNQSQLRSGGMRSVQKLANFFKQYPERNVLIEGFTDSTGTNSHNLELSNQRAAAVRSALMDMGVGTDRISSRGYGESFPIAGNDTAAGRQLNRRVEMIVSDEKGAIVPR